MLALSVETSICNNKKYLYGKEIVMQHTLPKIIFTIVNLLLLLLVIVIVIKSIQKLKSYYLRHKAMDEKLDMIIRKLEDEEHDEKL